MLAVLTRTKGDYRIEWRAVRLEKNMLGSICALGLPSAVQLAVTAFSNIFCAVLYQPLRRGLHGWLDVV